MVPRDSRLCLPPCRHPAERILHPLIEVTVPYGLLIMGPVTPLGKLYHIGVTAGADHEARVG